MKRNKRFWFLALCTLVLVSVVCATNLSAADEVTIIGTVYAEAWDKNDNVTAAVIAGSGEEEYVIIANAVGKELFKIGYKVVKATGVLGKNSEGHKTITVTRYEVMPE